MVSLTCTCKWHDDDEYMLSGTPSIKGIKERRKKMIIIAYDAEGYISV